MKTNTFSEKLDNILKQIFEQPVVRKQAKSAIIDLVLNDVIGEDVPPTPSTQNRLSKIEDRRKAINDRLAHQRAIITNEGEGDE